MAEEEFQESEIIFNENQMIIEEEYNIGYSNSNSNPKRKKIRAKKKKKKKNSVPMNIRPADNNNINARNSWFHVSAVDFSDDDDDDVVSGGSTGDEMVPPHMIIRQRVAGKVMPFSVCSGNGRTLKGRDLSQVRNSILRLTGFLET